MFRQSRPGWRYNMLAPYKRKEKRINQDAAMVALAKAVIIQWYYDGKPASDKEAIEYWFKIYQEANRFNDNSNVRLIGDIE